MTEPTTAAHRPLTFWLSPHSQRRILGVCFASALVFGTIGYRRYSAETPLIDAVYYAAQLFAMHAPHMDGALPWQLELGRWLAATTTLFAGFQIAHVMWREEWDAQRIRRMKKHVIICGLGRQGLAALRGLSVWERKRAIVIDKASTPDMVEACRKLGVHLLTGDATNPDILCAARIEYASILVTLCPEDSTNCDIAAKACSLRSKSSRFPAPLQCHIQVSDAQAREAFQKVFSRRNDKSNATIRFFDNFDPQVRQLLIQKLPLDHDGIKPGDVRPVHLIILGFGRMGRTLAVRAAQLGVFAQPGRLRISVIDRHAKVHQAEVLFRHPQMAGICDLEFHELEALSAGARALLQDWCSRSDTITSVAVCFDNEQRALEIVLLLKSLAGLNRSRVAVRMSPNSGLASLMSVTGKEVPKRMEFIPFGIVGTGGIGDGSAEVFARQIHAAYAKMRRAEAGQNPAKQLELANDKAVREWDDLPEDFRESSRQQYDHIHFKLRAVGMEMTGERDTRPGVPKFAPAQVEMLAEMEHRRWVAERLIAGWTHAQAPKNPERRTNPNLAEWDKLSEEIKDYDRKAVRLIPELLAGAGMKMVIRVGAV